MENRTFLSHLVSSVISTSCSNPKWMYKMYAEWRWCAAMMTACKETHKNTQNVVQKPNVSLTTDELRAYELKYQVFSLHPQHRFRSEIKFKRKNHQNQTPEQNRTIVQTFKPLSTRSPTRLCNKSRSYEYYSIIEMEWKLKVTISTHFLFTTSLSE